MSAAPPAEGDANTLGVSSPVDNVADAPTAVAARWLAWWQLLRFPAVFTALADILLGFSLTHVGLLDAPLPLALLLLTSGAIYLAGMVFNDVADRKLDAVERPQRPIPSGRVSLRGAIGFGVALVVTGLTAAASLQWVDPLLCGWNPLFVASLLVAAVALYDGCLKATVVGPLAMGLCRFLNVLLGASAAGALFGRSFDLPQRWVALGLGVYVAGVTWFARSEATESHRSRLIGALLVVNAGLVIWLAWVWRSILGADPRLALALLLTIGLTLNRRMVFAIATPLPATVQATVRTLLLSIITLDAALIYAKSGDIATATTVAIVLLIPALFLGRLIRIT